MLARWERYDLIAIDEVGYVPMAELGAEFLFQVIAERAEKAAVILTTNLPFSEWTQVIPNARLCKALLDRITDRAHIIETGAESYRFRRTVEKGRANPRADRRPRWTSGFRYASARSPAHLHPTSCPAIGHKWARVNCHRWAKKTCQTQQYTDTRRCGLIAMHWSNSRRDEKSTIFVSPNEGRASFATISSAIESEVLKARRYL